ncbi:MAG TPA: hypothetical protein GXZ36_01330 [Firmicutes bacterium]|jgi:hypothetical protein|nr:hypothetical protein [Bacillota bacterium]
MNPLADNNQKSPLWMQELLDKVKSKTFIADDEEAVLARYIMPSVGESPLSYDKLEELDEEDDFTRELARLVQAKWTGTKRELCAKALLLENTFYKIQAGKRLPGRDTIICLSLALGLNVEEAQHLLGYLGYGLSEHIKRDYMIMYCLEKGKSPLEVNLLLEKCGLRLLGPND